MLALDLNTTGWNEVNVKMRYGVQRFTACRQVDLEGNIFPGFIAFEG